MREIHITEREQGQRTDKFLMKYMALAPRSFIYKMLRKKNIKLNSGRAHGDEILKTGDVLNLYLSDETIDNFIKVKEINRTSALPDIIYEDENVIFCSKPQGIIVHPDNRHKTGTLNDMLLSYLNSKGEYIPGETMGFTPSICNRLDINTSGIVTMGKNLSAVQQLNRAFNERLADKYYIAVVKGEMKTGGHITGYLSKDENNKTHFSDNPEEGSFISTYYRALEYNKGFSLVEIKPETGRSHQIRLCMREAGFPIAGDRKYGDSSTNKRFYNEFGTDNQLLHNFRLVFNFTDGELSYLSGKEFSAPLPDNFSRVCSALFIGKY